LFLALSFSFTQTDPLKYHFCIFRFCPMHFALSHGRISLFLSFPLYFTLSCFSMCFSLSFSLFKGLREFIYIHGVVLYIKPKRKRERVKLRSLLLSWDLLWRRKRANFFDFDSQVIAFFEFACSDFLPRFRFVRFVGCAIQKRDLYQYTCFCGVWHFLKFSRFLAKNRNSLLT
jgi:hypothetical protein